MVEHMEREVNEYSLNGVALAVAVSAAFSAGVIFAVLRYFFKVIF